MANVHESLYFNPMMTNGVVQANVFSIKNFVTPYKIALLVLLDEITSAQITLVERRRLNKLILPLLQGPDMTLSQLINTIEECCSQVASAVYIRVQLIAEGELKDMEEFFFAVPSAYNGTEPEVQKTSVVEKKKQGVDPQAKMKRNIYTMVSRSEDTFCRGPLSQKQAEYFLTQQAYLLKNDENRALSPSALQKDLNNLLKFNPDFAEAHYLSYLNSLRVQDVFSSTHSLLHFFDRLILTGSDSKSNGDEGHGRSLRYAALNLAALHCRFGHYGTVTEPSDKTIGLKGGLLKSLCTLGKSERKLKQRLYEHPYDIKMQHENNALFKHTCVCTGAEFGFLALDTVAIDPSGGPWDTRIELCLQSFERRKSIFTPKLKALKVIIFFQFNVTMFPHFSWQSWLALLEEKTGSDSSVLLEHSVKKAVQFSLPYLASLGIQSLVQQRAYSGKTANKLMEALKDSDMLHWKHSLSELIDISIAQKTAIWGMFGQSTMAFLQAQILLSMNSLEAMNSSTQQSNTEAFAVVLCHLAELHAEQGCFAAASEILKHLKERFPPHSSHAKLQNWLLFQFLQFQNPMSCEGKYHVAESLVTGITALNHMEGLYRKALVWKAQNQTPEACKVLQSLLILCQKRRNTEMLIRVILLISELYCRSSCHTVALPLLLKALALSREYQLQYLASETILHLACSQLMLGIPEQALSILHMAIEPILAHGSVLDKGRAMFLTAKCQVASAAALSHDLRKEALQSAIQNLNEAKAYFVEVDCKERMRDVFYFQARLFHSLGNLQERNKCAMLFRQLDQELPSHGVPLITRL
ncbi:anaphase-promoting complex subunit 5 [Protopterus annectens]|uniref:anaphase-promoting complex subunit 5 n=1 Tax=Protopterus annectens TaxID=7888 RepID=UPI001CFA9886|nr:anaphase-promoting complex subunit 5 [Protopterus annectens]